MKILFPYRYFTYGMTIESQLLLPQLDNFIKNPGCGLNKTGSDVFLTLENHFIHKEYLYNKAVYSQINRQKSILSIKKVGTFVMEHGNKIHVYPHKNHDEKMIQTITVNTLMSIILYQRGKLVLHSSAVKMNDGIVAFSGTSGAGKSLMASALCALGYPLFTDDVVPIETSSGSMLAYPGYPMTRVKPDEVAIFGFKENRMTLLHEKENRCNCSLPEGFDQNPSFLKYVFILGIGRERCIERMSPREAFIYLAANTAPGIWGLTPDETDFSNLKMLVEHVPVYRFVREQNLAALPEHARMIEQFVSENSLNRARINAH